MQRHPFQKVNAARELCDMFSGLCNVCEYGVWELCGCDAKTLIMTIVGVAKKFAQRLEVIVIEGGADANRLSGQNGVGQADGV